MRYRYFETSTLLLLASFLAIGTAHGADLSGTYTSTQTITEDSRLTGDVTCNITVPGPGPCIKFGAPKLELDLNGHTITGTNPGFQGVNYACSSLLAGDRAIDTNSQDGVEIEGPGIITLFRESGINVTGSHSKVHHVVITGVCLSGIGVGGSNNEIYSNSISRFSFNTVGACGFGIGVGGAGNHNIHENEVTGAGPYVQFSSNFPCGFGIYVGSTGNRISRNNSSGNTTGILIKDSPGNTVEGNQALGNATYDINDDGGGNLYLHNLCQTTPGLPVCPGRIPAELIGHR